MANGNGRVWGIIGTLVVLAVGSATALVVGQVRNNSEKVADSASQVVAVDRRVDSVGMALKDHIKDAEVTMKIQNFQLAEIAKKIGARVLVDTTVADTLR